MASKVDIIADVAATLGSTKVAAKEALEAVLDAIQTCLDAKEDVKFVGFGTFKVKETKARTGRNPQTGAEIQIPAGTKISFKASK